jgi:hypothetical protein
MTGKFFQIITKASHLHPVLQTVYKNITAIKREKFRNLQTLKNTLEKDYC